MKNIKLLFKKSRRTYYLIIKFIMASIETTIAKN